jgi:hypothetical protein
MAKRYKITECNVDDVISSLRDYVSNLTDNEQKRKEIVSTISGIARSLEQDSQRVIPGVPGVVDPTQNVPMVDEVPQIEFNANGELEVLPNELELVHDPENPEGAEELGGIEGEGEDEFDEFDNLADKELEECVGGGAAMTAQAAQGGSDAQGGGVNHPENPKNVTAILYSDPRKKKKKTKLIKHPSLETNKK